MENTRKKLKKVLPSLVLLAVIALLVGLSFTVSHPVTTVTAAEHTLDPEAVRVLEECRAYAGSHDFETELDGKIRARVMGVPYVQKLHGGRKVEGEDFSETAESVSALVKAALKKQCKGGEYSVTHGEYKKKRFSYGAGETLSREDYIKSHGMPSTGLVRYELDGAVLGAEKTGENTYTYTLDVRRATAYCANEVRTTLGSKKPPEYSSVSFTLTCVDGRAEKIVSEEKFRVDKYGGLTCTAEYTETFTYIE